MGFIAPWLLAAVLNHLQVYALLITWTSLACGVVVSVISSLLMWTTQIEEALIHEINFKESISMLVVQNAHRALKNNEDGQPDSAAEADEAPAKGKGDVARNEKAKDKAALFSAGGSAAPTAS